jgi:hypothetical protein
MPLTPIIHFGNDCNPAYVLKILYMGDKNRNFVNLYMRKTCINRSVRKTVLSKVLFVRSMKWVM